MRPMTIAELVRAGVHGQDSAHRDKACAEQPAHHVEGIDREVAPEVPGNEGRRSEREGEEAVEPRK